MSGTPQVVAIVLVAFALIAAVLLTREASMDFASPLRRWLWSRDARRYAARNAFPATLRRSYWNEREYRDDKRRLEALGYRIVSAETSDPYVIPEGWATRGQPPRRRVPMYFVVYEYRADGGRGDETGAGTQ